MLFPVTLSSFIGTRECRKCGVHSSDGWHLNIDAIHLWMLTWAGCPGRAIFIYQIHICAYYLILNSWRRPLSLFSRHMWFPLFWLESEQDWEMVHQWWDVRVPGIPPRTIEPPHRVRMWRRLWMLGHLCLFTGFSNNFFFINEWSKIISEKSFIYEYYFLSKLWEILQFKDDVIFCNKDLSALV